MYAVIALLQPPCNINTDSLEDAAHSQDNTVIRHAFFGENGDYVWMPVFLSVIMFLNKVLFSIFFKFVFSYNIESKFKSNYHVIIQMFK